MEVRTTQDGLLRAFGLLMGQQRTIKKKFAYSSAGSAVHAARRLTKAEHETIFGLLKQLKTLNPRNDADSAKYQELLKELSKQPVKFVPMKYEHRIDYSKPYRRAA